MSELSSTGDQMLVVLDIVARHGPVSVAEAARLCGINRTVAHRLLATLGKHNFVVKLKEGYVLGMRPYELASLAQPSLISAARPVLQRLADECQETVVLHGPVGRDAVVLDQVVHEGHLIVVRHMPGSRHLLTRGASGWSILAFLDSTVIAKVLEGLPEGAREECRTRISQVRAQGWALTRDELQMGVCGLAAPVFGAGGDCIASLAVIVPNMWNERLEGLQDRVVAASTALTRTLQAMT